MFQVWPGATKVIQSVQLCPNNGAPLVQITRRYTGDMGTLARGEQACHIHMWSQVKTCEKHRLGQEGIKGVRGPFHSALVQEEAFRHVGEI